MKARLALVLVGIGVLAMGIGLLSRPAAIAAANPPAVIRDRLSRAGETFTPLDDVRASRVSSEGITAADARRLAEGRYRRGTVSGVYLGAVTDTKQHVGETEESPLAISDVPAYVVLFDNVSMYLHGPWRGKQGQPSATISVTVAVFVNAMSGAEITTTTL